MTSDRFADDAEAARNVSPTGHLLEELALYAHRPYDDEADPRPLPEPAKLQGALADMFDALVATLSDTRLEPDLHTLLWSLVNVFHRRIDRIERDLDENERAQRTGQREQDGSEVRSVELERLVAQGLTLIERRNSFEFLRDVAAELYGLHTGQAWRPYTGSMVNRATMTAAMIDSREFINARRRADAQVLLPKGTRIAFAGGVECNDHHRIWAVLDKVMAKHSDMVLLHGGTPRGAEKIAACWADARKVSQVVFKPDWTRHQKAAPFKRNDQLLGSPADRHRRVPRLRCHRQPRRQGQGDGHPAVRFPQGGRRVSAALAASPRPGTRRKNSLALPAAPARHEQIR